jgi:hypothetical protein
LMLIHPNSCGKSEAIHSYLEWRLFLKAPNLLARMAHQIPVIQAIKSSQKAKRRLYV